MLKLHATSKIWQTTGIRRQRPKQHAKLKQERRSGGVGCACCCSGEDGPGEAENVQVGAAELGETDPGRVPNPKAAAVYVNPSFATGSSSRSSAVPTAAPTAADERCKRCNAKVKFCTCDVRRNTTDMAAHGGGNVASEV